MVSETKAAPIMRGILKFKEIETVHDTWRNEVFLRAVAYLDTPLAISACIGGESLVAAIESRGKLTPVARNDNPRDYYPIYEKDFNGTKVRASLHIDKDWITAEGEISMCPVVVIAGEKVVDSDTEKSKKLGIAFNLINEIKGALEGNELGLRKESSLSRSGADIVWYVDAFAVSYTNKDGKKPDGPVYMYSMYKLGRTEAEELLQLDKEIAERHKTISGRLEDDGGGSDPFMERLSNMRQEIIFRGHNSIAPDGYLTTQEGKYSQTRFIEDGEERIEINTDPAVRSKIINGPL